jgi:hypothetical protein
LQDSEKPKQTGMRDFWVILAVLAAVRFVLPLFGIPLGILPFVNILITILFLSLPVIAIYRAMSDCPTPKQALVLLLLGVTLQAGAIALDLKIFKGQGIGSMLVEPLKPTGLQVWCIGLGALVAALVRDKNSSYPLGYS